jgi:IS66 Orf2 like protein
VQAPRHGVGNGVHMGIVTDKRSSAVSPPTAGGIAIYLCQDPVGFRLGITGLSVLVEATLKFDPFSGNLFCLSTTGANRLRPSSLKSAITPLLEQPAPISLPVAPDLTIENFICSLRVT